MRFNVKDMDIATGGPLVAILHKKDAEKFDLHHGDRIKIIKGKKVETVVVDIAESERAVPKGQIGLLKEVLSSLKLKNKDKVEIQPARKPLSLDYIKKKLDGYTLSKKEIDQIAWDISHNKLSDIELTYFVSACYSHALNSTETALLTKAIAEQGDILRLNRYPIIDKHCVGGVAGNRTTMVIVPIIAAAGLTIPKTSSRSITSPAGTADTMEVLAKVSFPLNKIKKLVLRHHGCMVWGGALNLAPSDDKIIRVEKPLSIDAESQLLASIMAKKYSVSSTHILIDIPTGKGTKITSYKRAIKLKNDFYKLAKKLKKTIKVIITDGSQPIGNGIGPALQFEKYVIQFNKWTDGDITNYELVPKQNRYMDDDGSTAQSLEGMFRFTFTKDPNYDPKKSLTYNVKLVGGMGGSFATATAAREYFVKNVLFPLLTGENRVNLDKGIPNKQLNGVPGRVEDPETPRPLN